MRRSKKGKSHAPSCCWPPLLPYPVLSLSLQVAPAAAGQQQHSGPVRAALPRFSKTIGGVPMARLTATAPQMWIFSACLGRLKVDASQIRPSGPWVAGRFAERRADDLFFFSFFFFLAGALLGAFSPSSNPPPGLLLAASTHSRPEQRVQWLNDTLPIPAIPHLHNSPGRWPVACWFVLTGSEP